MKGHITSANHGKRQSAICRAIRKYGNQAFSIEELETGISNQRELDTAEIYWIAWYQTSSPRGYNIREGGSGGKLPPDVIERLASARRGTKMSEEQKAKISKALLGNKNTLGRTHSEATKQKMRVAKLGRKVSEETRQKMRDAQTGRPGRKVSEETRYKLRIAAWKRRIAKEMLLLKPK